MITNTLSNAFNSIWPMLTIFLIVIIIVRIAYLRTNSKEFVFYKELLSLFFIIYLILLFELVTNTDSGGGVNLIPFTEILRYSLKSDLFFYNVIGNIVVFLPFGYFISAYIKSKSVGQIFLITLITSLTIELVQLKIGRAFDIDDIILNVLGGVLGFLLYVGLTAIKKHLPGLFQKNIFYNILSFILIILAVLYFLGIYRFGW